MITTCCYSLSWITVAADKHLADGMEILACIMESGRKQLDFAQYRKELILRRWLHKPATIVPGGAGENGTVDVPNDNGGVDTAVIYSGEHGAISAYPGPERFCTRQPY
ncbi:hypothetical protein MJ571_11220 [Klebsiella pneumoniae]|nr:hypothetical protein MJ571_11220 [Klebsiella pneumoniae]